MSASLLIIGPEPSKAVVDRFQGRGIEVRHRVTATPDELRAAPPTAALIEWELDSGSGSGVCRRLKRDPELASVFVILTGDEVPALDAHRDHSPFPADAYLPRPFEPDALLAVLAKALARMDAAPPRDEPLSEPDRSEDVDRERQLRDQLEALRAPPETTPPTRANPEERLQWFRDHVRALEVRHRELMTLSEALLAHAKELRRIADEARAAATRAESDRLVARAETERLERQFKTYEAEVHRVVRAKQDEEKAIAEALKEARDEARAHDRRASSAEGRVAALERELAAAGTRLGSAERALQAVRSHLAERDAEVSGLRKRLAESDTLLDDMQGEVVRLRSVAGVQSEARDRLVDLERARAALKAILNAGLDRV